MKSEFMRVYETKDGALFKDKAEALAHEEKKEWEQFVATIGSLNIRISNSDVEKLIGAWELFKAKERIANSNDRPIDFLDLTCRTRNCLKAEGIDTIGHLLTWSSHGLLKTPNLGRKSLNEIIETLERLSLSLNEINPTHEHIDLHQQETQ
jgi:DNA-directed RNA polymerase alpha subunit